MAVNFLKKFSLKEIELLSSVLLAWTSLVASGYVGSVNEVVQYITDWKFTKFSDDEIDRALEVLTDNGWINPRYSGNISHHSELIKI
jgi:hypothetical protein